MSAQRQHYLLVIGNLEGRIDSGHRDRHVDVHLKLTHRTMRTDSRVSIGTTASAFAKGLYVPMYCLSLVCLSLVDKLCPGVHLARACMQYYTFIKVLRVTLEIYF